MKSFDVVNARLLFSFMPTKAWPGLLKECLRILRPGGLVCLTECEVGITNGPISEQLSYMFVRAMQRAGMIFSPDARHVGITPMLGGLLRDAGFVDIRQKAETIDYSAGSPIHDAFCENIMVGSKLAQPFMIKMGITTQEEVDRALRALPRGGQGRRVPRYLVLPARLGKETIVYIPHSGSGGTSGRFKCMLSPMTRSFFMRDSTA